MPLTKLQFRPGINREVTSYSNEGGWYDCDKVRFRFGFPEKIGGWQKYTSSTYLGSARSLHNWVALDGSDYLGIGTHLKYYIEEGGDINDITPLRDTTSAGDVTFSATNGSATITVTDVSHGANENDFVTFSGAVSLGGNITADVLNQNYQIVTVVDADTYTFTATATANASDTGNGGASVVGAYEIAVGLDTTVGGTGWGAGTWGRSTWGSASATATSAELRLWSQDNFGEDLLINPVDSGIYYWDKTNGTGTRAIELSTLSGTPTSVPTIAKQVLVSDNDRHVIAFGCDGVGANSSATQGDGVQDPLLIRFSSQENPLDWWPTATNTAGDLRLGSGSEFVTAKETKREVLVWTNKSLHSMRYIGAPFTFGISQLANNITIMGPKAVASVNDTVFWMGLDSFYIHSGQTQEIPCSVKDKVFLDFNLAQRDKVTVGINTEFTEVIWFYPSSSSSDNDSYVAYNYGEKVWYYGTLSRTAWIDRGIRSNPIALNGGYLYNHEIGYDDDGSAMSAYIESSQMDIGDGEQFTLIRRLIPDLTFDGSTNLDPSANFTLQTRNYPGGNYLQSASGTTTRTATSPVEQFTNQLNMRLRGRSFAIKVDSSAEGVRWKLGSPRVDIRTDGRR